MFVSKDRHQLKTVTGEPDSFHVIHKFGKDLTDLSYTGLYTIAISAQHLIQKEMLVTVKEDKLILDFIFTTML